MQTRPTRGSRMKITSRSVSISPVGGSAGTASVDSAEPVATGAAENAPLQAATLGPAQAALEAMPEIDNARVAAVRDALARGEIQFDAKRLAGLIERFHGGRG